MHQQSKAKHRALTAEADELARMLMLTDDTLFSSHISPSSSCLNPSAVDRAIPTPAENIERCCHYQKLQRYKLYPIRHPPLQSASLLCPSEMQGNFFLLLGLRRWCSLFLPFLRPTTDMPSASSRLTDRQNDRSDFIICPVLCYSNGTDNNVPTHKNILAIEVSGRIKNWWLTALKPCRLPIIIPHRILSWHAAQRIVGTNG